MIYYTVAAAVLALASQASPQATTSQLAPVPLQENKPCPYPDRAREAQAAGIVSYTARLRADGSVASVTIGRIPSPDLDFAHAVHVCVSEWRFTPAARKNDHSRVYEGQVRFRRATAEEDAVRAQLEKLVAAWNAGDEAAVADLQVRPDDWPTGQLPSSGPLLEQLRALAPLAGKKAELAPEVDLFWFLRSNVVQVRQRYSLAAAEGAAPEEQPPLQASLLKGSRGWRFVGLASPGTEANPIKVGGEIQPPMKVKEVAPVYPEIAKQARVQGDIVLECTLSAEGAVVQTRVLIGIPLLDQAAIDAVRQWRYAPTFVGGKAVSVIMTVTVKFRLQ